MVADLGFCTTCRVPSRGVLEGVQGFGRQLRDLRIQIVT